MVAEFPLCFSVFFGGLPWICSGMGGDWMCIPGILIYRNKSYTTGILMFFFGYSIVIHIYIYTISIYTIYIYIFIYICTIYIYTRYIYI